MKAELEKLVKIRLGLETDQSFIFATWLRGLYYGSSFFRIIDKDEFMQFYGRVIQNVFNKPGILIQVACLKEDEDTICGYSLTESLQDLEILHWMFVKPEWRGQGIAKHLVPDRTNVITHVVDSMFKSKLKKDAKSDRYLSNYELKLKFKDWAFKPFLI